MRRLLGRLLRSIGLARATRADALARDLRHASRRIEKLEQALAACRQAAARDAESHRLAKLHLKEAMHLGFNERVAVLQRQLADASRDRLLAKSHLALVETKLDILEGAIQALDTRTREVLMARDQARSPQGS